jgi:hypothetical protein
MVDPQVAFDKLAGFQTAYELADFFKAENIKGEKASHNKCPIATWMKKTTGVYSSAADQIVVQNGNFDPYDFIPDFNVKVTEMMKDFMHKFDRGEFPELVK